MIDVGRLPHSLRVKLKEEKREELWAEVDERGAEKFTSEGYSRASIYSWRNKDLFLPVEFARMFELEWGDIERLKPGGNGTELDRPDFQSEDLREVYTRIECSVSVNQDGVPFYRSSDYGRVRRFSKLLDSQDIDHSIYERESGFQLRFPKALHDIIKSMKIELDKTVVFDEDGSFENKPVLNGEKLEIDDYRGKVFTSSKRLRLAVINGDRDEINRLMESGVRSAFDISDRMAD